MKKPRDFSARSLQEQQILTYDSWCDTCNQADIGMREPQEFEEDGEIIVEGLCNKCGGTVRNIITVTTIKPIE